MGVWLEGWTGDLAGKLPGRKPNQLLVTFTGDSLELIPADMWASNKDIYPGLTWYYNIDLSIATPDVGWPIAVGIEQLIGWNDTWAIDIANADGQQYGEWASGVHLFSVNIWLNSPGPTSNSASTFATAIIEPAPHWRKFTGAFSKEMWMFMQERKKSRLRPRN